MRPSLSWLMWSLRLRSATTQTSDAERATLARCANGRKCLLEIGVFQGVNTRMFRRVMAEDGLLVAVDPFFVGKLGFSFDRQIAQAEVRRERNGQVVWVRDVSPSAASPSWLDPDLRFDFAFIDGDHSFDAVALDWETWSPKIAPSGVIAFHDSFNCGYCGSERFVREIVEKDVGYGLIERIDSLSVFEKH